MKNLGIDYGKKKIGLAIAEGMSASPYKVIEVSSLVDALQQIVRVIEKESIDQVIIGIAESGESKSMTEKFIKELEKKITVVQVEETLSSHFADKQMLEMGVQKSKKGQNDAVAAAFILQEYLDSKI